MYQEVISLNLWQIIISLLNLVIVYFILKRFLYKPVTDTIKGRRAEIEGVYSDAKKQLAEASADRELYEAKLSLAEEEIGRMRKTEKQSAISEGKQIIAQSKIEAEAIIRRANRELQLEKIKAREDMKRQIAEASTLIAEKLMGESLNDEINKRLADDFIEGFGDFI